MPVYKDETTNTWYCKFYYSTLGGKRKQTTKRGFSTKREAKQWQNVMREKGFAPTYLRMIQNQLTALFNHASNIYGLKSNPCKRVKKMGICITMNKRS